MMHSLYKEILLRIFFAYLSDINLLGLFGFLVQIIFQEKKCHGTCGSLER